MTTHLVRRASLAFVLLTASLVSSCGTDSSTAPGSMTIAKKLFTKTAHNMADGTVSQRNASVSDVENWLGQPDRQSHQDFGGGFNTQSWTYFNEGRFAGSGNLRIEFIGDFVDNAFLGDECLVQTLTNNGGR